MHGSGIVSRLVQMPPPKVSFFGTFLKIESKIRKIIKFQNNTKFALVDEFLQNLRQMKDLGLHLHTKIEKLIFDNFLHVLHHFEHKADPDFRKSRKYHDLLHFSNKK